MTILLLVAISPDILLETNVQVINNTLCQKMWAPGLAVVQDTVVCVDNREPFSPVCNVRSRGEQVEFIMTIKYMFSELPA